jgi:MoaD family protein
MTGYIRVLLAATFREIAGQREILKEVGSGITLGEVLTTLVERYARDFNAIIDSKTGRIGLETWVMVNGKSVRRTNIELRENDVVVITIPVGGG